jgi:DNA-binding CsgD family transcriptional regulator
MLITDQATSHGVTSEFGDPEHNELCQLWHELFAERARIVTAGTSADVHFFEIGPNVAGPRSEKRRAARSACLIRALLGESPKFLQADMGLSASTIATRIGDCLEALGLPRRGHRTPLLLVIMAHAMHGKLPSHHLQVMRRSLPSGEGWVIWCSRPELKLVNQLSPGELDVLNQLVAGKTYSEIARHRRTAERTIANQIAAVYAKLDLSGRPELLHHLAGLVCSESRPLPASPRSYAPPPLAAAV